MKIKSHKSKWAMALCAVAFFSFTAAHAAQVRLPVENLDQGKTPQGITDQNSPLTKPPLPAAPPTPVDDGPVPTGSFNGTVIV
jgi:hypothetical protein